MSGADKISRTGGSSSARNDSAKVNKKQPQENNNVDFSKSKSNVQQQKTIVSKILIIGALKTPEKYMNTKNILLVMDNYEKDHNGNTLIGDFIKTSDIPRDERKAGAINTFEILYKKALTGAKTEFQKQELARLKAEFNATVTDELDNSWFEWGVSNSKANEIVGQVQKMYTASSEELAHEIYDHADDNHFSYADKDFRYLLESINSGNAIEVANKVKNYDKNKNHDSLLKILNDEYTNPISNEQKPQKKAQMKNFVTSFMTAAGYKDSPYFAEATKLLEDGKIDEVDSILNTMIVKQPKAIAASLYKIIDDNSYALSRTDVKILMDKLNSSNVKDIQEEFKKASGNKTTLLQMINEEWGDDKIKKSYIEKIVKAQFDTTGLVNNKKVAEHVNASLKNETVKDTELLMASLGKNKDIGYMSKTLFNALSKDKNNVNKEYVNYLLNGVDEKNVVKFMNEFNKISGGIPITQYLQKKGDATANEHILSLTDKLLTANQAIFDNEQFSSTFGVLKSDVAKYIRDNIKDKEDITRVVNSFLNTTTRNIAKNIEDIASDKNGANDDISFKLWVSRINSKNASSVIKEFKNAYGQNKTPINAIIEERMGSVSSRQKQVLHILSSVVGELDENRVNQGIISDFVAQLEDELFTLGMASADKLNAQLDKISAGIPEKGEIIATEEATTVDNVRPDIAKIELGEKYGKFSWQYSNLKDIKSIEDVAKFTGLSVSYLNELKISEGVKKKAYDCSADKRTIGIGHNFHYANEAEKAYLNKTELTDSEMYQILARDIVMSIGKLQQNTGIDTSKLNQGEFEALLDVSFNAPGYMNTLTQKTKNALAIRESGNTQQAQKAFDEAAYEFNQQLAKGQIAPGLCKRRVRNILRYIGVNNFNELPKDSEARKRITILALNGHSASSIIRKKDYLKDICEIMGISESEYADLTYPAGYKPV
ncbi:MAG: hypothetical protein NC390_06890 [Fusobacterium sp.]|nr:hypothetical protein [Fusobacterium sp.]